MESVLGARHKLQNGGQVRDTSDVTSAVSPCTFSIGSNGWGLNENVTEAYDWLRSNYASGDEVFLFGFSRGAFTARAIGGLISRIGYIGKTVNFQTIYDEYQRQGQNGTGLDEYSGWFQSTEPIKVIGVWDTVGALGTPGKEMGPSYAFHNTKISPSKLIVRFSLSISTQSPRYA